MKPESKYLRKSKFCKSNWLAIKGNNEYLVRCKTCGVYLMNGGIPKCLQINPEEN